MDAKLKCSLCLDEFRDPRILTCFHSFCKECLQGYINNSDTVRNHHDSVKFTCPVCRSEIELPQRGVDGLQKNFYLPDTAESTNEASHPFCPDHNKEDLSFFCRDCQVAICRDCKVVSHTTHATDMVDTVADEMRQKLEKLLDETEAELDKKDKNLLESVKNDISVFESPDFMRISKEIEQDVTEMYMDVVDKFNLHYLSRQNILSLLEEDGCSNSGGYSYGRYMISRYERALSRAVENKQSHVIMKIYKDLFDSDHKINKMKEMSLFVQCRLKANPPKMIVFTQKLKEAYEELSGKIKDLLDEFRDGDAMKSPMESSTLRLNPPRSKRQVEVADGPSSSKKQKLGESSTDNTATQSSSSETGSQIFEGEVKCKLTGPVPHDLCPLYGDRGWSLAEIVLTKGDPHWSLEVQLCQSDHRVKDDLKVRLDKKTLLSCRYHKRGTFKFQLCYPPASNDRITVKFRFRKNNRQDDKENFRNLKAVIKEIRHSVEKEDSDSESN